MSSAGAEKLSDGSRANGSELPEEGKTINTTAKSTAIAPSENWLREYQAGRKAI